MKHIITFFLCCLIYSAQAQNPPDINDRSHSTPPFFPQAIDSSIILLNHWKDSLRLDKKGVKLLDNYNECIHISRSSIEGCKESINNAKWLIERGEQARAVEYIRLADVYNKRANEYDKKARHYLELINKRRKQ